LLLAFNGVNRASRHAGAAVDADVGVNDEDRVARSDAIHRTFRYTRAARNAFIIDYMCHKSTSLIN